MATVQIVSDCGRRTVMVPEDTVFDTDEVCCEKLDGCMVLFSPTSQLARFFQGCAMLSDDCFEERLQNDATYRALKS